MPSPAVVQRQVPLGEVQQVKDYYDLRIREIGSPTNPRHRRMRDYVIANAPSAEEAKRLIREYIADWNRGISEQAAEPVAPRVAPPDQASVTAPVSVPDASGFAMHLAPDEIRSNLSALTPRGGNFQHFDLRAYRRLTHGGRVDLLSMLAGNRTPYELFLARRPSGPEVTVFRYHKFPKSAVAMHLITGGGLNKAEITGDLGNTAVTRYLKVRQRLLSDLGTAVGPARAKLMEKFQANAMSTPFIATTSDYAYAAGLFEDYPPDDSQIAVLLAIRGPINRLFDFEGEFRRVGAAGGGSAASHWRTTAKRKKDAEQREYGISDLVIPTMGVSESGFRIVGVIRLN